MDWEGEKRVGKSKELKNATVSDGFEAKPSGPEDLVESPIQPDRKKFQRENCSRVTDETLQNLSDKIFDIPTAESHRLDKFYTYYLLLEFIGYTFLIKADLTKRLVLKFCSLIKMKPLSLRKTFV